MVETVVPLGWFHNKVVDRKKWEAAKGNPTQLPSLHSSKFAPDVAPTVAMGVEAMTAAAMDLLGKR